MPPACRRPALRAPLPTLLLPYLGALPSLSMRDHLFAEVELGETTALAAEPGPAKSQNVSEIVGAATEQTLEPLQRTQKALQARLQELDAKMVELKDDETMGQPVPIDEVDPGCQGDFTKLPAAARQPFVGFAKCRGACENRAMVPEGANLEADLGFRV
ncbi:unnamed protein product [Prorocentrum cordatum]|uniref:Uncharacterized protein n=1 Tax=Prorocentrum cordatum TaxID=2364126 RepID=A0ABN9YB59_9DINO|nr:unnamed protein product [Polarella glacialis]